MPHLRPICEANLSSRCPPLKGTTDVCAFFFDGSIFFWTKIRVVLIQMMLKKKQVENKNCWSKNIQIQVVCWKKIPRYSCWKKQEPRERRVEFNDGMDELPSDLAYADNRVVKGTDFDPFWFILIDIFKPFWYMWKSVITPRLLIYMNVAQNLWGEL